MKNTGIPTQQIGSAIVVALFIVALVVIAATAMLTRYQQDMRRTELILNSDQANLYAQGSIGWATDQLINDWKLQKPQQIIDKTPIQSLKNKMNNATIDSMLYDAQGFYNLNNLTSVDYRESFSRLVKAVVPTIKDSDLQAITFATMAWVSANIPSSAFDEYYAKLNPPYRTPHHLMASPSELRLVKGMTPELYQKLLPFITALPATTTININNAPAPVLMSLAPTLSLEAAKGIEVRCKTQPFPSTQDFLNFDVVKNNNIPGNKITTTSNYFLLKTIVTIGDQKTILYTLLQREIINSQPVVKILLQSKGTL